jgi:elongation factor P
MAKRAFHSAYLRLGFLLPGLILLASVRVPDIITQKNIGVSPTITQIKHLEHNMVAYVNGNGVRPGYVIKYNDKLYRVMTSEHRSPGKGRAFTQAKLRNLMDGLQTEVKFRSDEQVERCALEQIKMEYLYNDPSSGHCFMNSETFEQIFLDETILKDSIKFLLPNTHVQIEFYEETALGVALPEAVELEVTETDPPLKGATASGSGKPATLETGLVVTVPNFIEIGEKVKVSTTSGNYLERAKK